MPLLRALALFLTVFLAALWGRGPLEGLWLPRALASPESSRWGRVLWITGSGRDAPEPATVTVLEAAQPRMVVWCPPDGPGPGPRRVQQEDHPPPGGGQLFHRLDQLQETLAATALEALEHPLPGPSALGGPPRIDFSTGPGSLTVSQARGSPEALRGRVLVVGAAENLNGPPSPRGPLPPSRAVAWGLQSVLDGTYRRPAKPGIGLLLGLGLGAAAWVLRLRRSGPGLLAPLALLALVPVVASLLAFAGGLVLEPTAPGLGLVAGALLASRGPRQDDKALLRKALERLQEGVAVEEVLAGLPPALAQQRRPLYEVLGDPARSLPRPLATWTGPELTALAEALHEADRPVADRLEVLEWALLANPESTRAQELMERAQEEISTELALLDLASLKADLDPRFQDLELVGQGTMGLVLEGRDVALDRPVAVKLVNPAVLGDEDTVERFWRETEALSALTHPHVVQIYGAYRARVPYYSMEHLRGETLQDAMERDAFPPAARLAALAQLADALDHLHEREILHRDLKPENLVLVAWDPPRPIPEGEEPPPPPARAWHPLTVRLVVIDFGVSRAEGARPLTKAGDVLGTLAYMAPEQVRGEPVDTSADRFAFGVIAWEVLTGSRPFRNPYQVKDAPPPDLSRIHPEAPPALVRELAALLSEDPRRRPESLAAMRDLLACNSFF